jgi:hypothetical protein
MEMLWWPSLIDYYPHKICLRICVVNVGLIRHIVKRRTWCFVHRWDSEHGAMARQVWYQRRHHSVQSHLPDDYKLGIVSDWDYHRHAIVFCYLRFSFISLCFVSSSTRWPTESEYVQLALRSLTI